MKIGYCSQILIWYTQNTVPWLQKRQIRKLRKSLEIIRGGTFKCSFYVKEDYADE